MKKIFVVLGLYLLSLSAGYAQERVLTWSIGEVTISCEETQEICYPVYVAIDNEANTPQLANSTIRFIYDAGVLSNLQISNLENGYSVSGTSASEDVFGTSFNTPYEGGVYYAFDLNANSSNPIDLSTTPTHVFDVCFTLGANANFPLCVPFIFDNVKVNGSGVANDDSYRNNNAGIVGNYFTGGNTGVAIAADDEVVNFLWTHNPAFDGTLSSINEIAGTADDVSGCLEDPCFMPPPPPPPPAEELPALGLGLKLVFAMLLLSLIIFVFLPKLR